MFKEIPGIEAVDDSTCTLYDIFLHVFTKLYCLKDSIIAIIPSESHDDIYSIYERDDEIILISEKCFDGNEETGLLTSLDICESFICLYDKVRFLFSL